MADNCSQSFLDMPYTYQLYEDINTVQIVLYSIAPVLTLFSVMLFFESVMYVRAKIPVKIRRNRLIWILGIFPIFSTTSLLGLFLPRSTLITMFSSSVYFSVAIYQFMLLIIDYYGGRDSMISIMKDVDVKISVPPVLCICPCLPKIQITNKSQPWLRRGVLQVAFIQPASLFVSAVLWTDGRYVPGDLTISQPYFWLSLIQLISTMAGMQSLAIVFQSSKTKLEDYRITSKYLAIQLSMMFSNIQLAVLAFLSSIGVIPCTEKFSSLALTYHIYNFLVVCEFFALGIFARAFFRSRKMENLPPLGYEIADLESPMTDKEEITRDQSTPQLKHTSAPSPNLSATHKEKENGSEAPQRQRIPPQNGDNQEPNNLKRQKTGFENTNYISDIVKRNPDIKKTLSTEV
ncbi:organic solute transporter subunit alpha-like [Ptychodera flava]|uniref:organic solute transporter subunit alpha-like n=1 Tax=Ptychodera flava TaxID=63121 RepID=UPI00396A86C9